MRLNEIRLLGNGLTFQSVNTFVIVKGKKSKAASRKDLALRAVLSGYTLAKTRREALSMAT